MVAVDAHRSFPDSMPAAGFGNGHRLPGRNHAQATQPPAHDADRMVVNHADLPQAEMAFGERKLSRLARVGKGSPMDAEGGWSVNLTEQPQIDLVESLHAASDTLVVVDCICGGRRRDHRQVIGAQTPGASTAEQFAQAEVKAQS